MGSCCNIFVLFERGLCICISQVVKFYVSKLWSSEAKEKVKMASGGMVLIKYLLFFFNFIFWVSIFLFTWPLLETNECCTFLEAVKLMHNTPYTSRGCVLIAELKVEVKVYICIWLTSSMFSHKQILLLSEPNQSRCLRNMYRTFENRTSLFRKSYEYTGRDRKCVTV